MSTSASQSLRILGGTPLTGTAQVPADLDVLACEIVLAGIAEGRSQLTAPPHASALDSLIATLRALGVSIEQGTAGLVIDGVGLRGLRMPPGALDCGRNFTALGLVTGLIAAQPFGTRVTAHASLQDRSVENITGPLRARGAHVAGRVASQHAAPTAPISIAPLMQDEPLHALDCTLPVPDAAAKAALLMSALYANGTTTIVEPVVSPDHMERLFVGLGLPLRRIGTVVHFDPQGWNRRVPALGALRAPGCVTCAAFACAAALMVPRSHIALSESGGNPSRAGFFDMLRLWSAPVRVLPRGDSALREPTQDLVVRHGALRGGVLGGELLLRARQEVAALAVLASAAQRDSQFHDLDALTMEVGPQAGTLAPLLSAFGVNTQWFEGALHVKRSPGLRPARVDAHDNPEHAMAAVVLGLTAPGETVVEHGIDAVELSHPGFLAMLRSLGARIDTP